MSNNFKFKAESIPTKDELFEHFKDGTSPGFELEDGAVSELKMWRICWECGSGDSWVFWAEGSVGEMRGRFIGYCNTDPVGKYGHIHQADNDEYFGH